MEGWKETKGEYTNINFKDEEIWQIFYGIFSNNSKKTTSYKFAFLKIIMEFIINSDNNRNLNVDFNELFYEFSKIYWSLIVNNNIKPSNKITSVERIFNKFINLYPEIKYLSFNDIDNKIKQDIICNIKKTAKKYVIGAMWADSKKTFYNFSLKEEKLVLNPIIVDFILANKKYLFQILYLDWLIYMKKINSDENLVYKLLEIENN